MFKNAIGELILMLTWLAPTENVDGTPIDYAITYQLYIDGAPTMVFPGTLNTDSRYEFPLADVPALDQAGDYSITLTAFPQGVDLDAEPGRESDQSNAVIVTRVPVVPLPPADVSTE